MKNPKNVISRRRFLGSAALGMAGMVVLPGIAGSCKSEKKSTDIRMGFIGLGRQSMFLLSGFLELPGTQVVAGCDVYGIKRERFKKRVSDFYTKNKREFKVDLYEKFEDLLNRKDIDAVVIAVPDHTHARIAIAACKAG
jgi:predicted dehydrogenase